jgi:hypothetical protein
MDRFTKAGGKTTKLMAKAGSFMLMETFMMAIGRMTKLTDSVSIPTSMAPGMRVIGKRINSTEKALRLGLMVPLLKEIMLKGRNTGLAASLGLTKANTMESSRRTILKEKVFTNGVTAETLKVTGRTIKWRVTESSLGLIIDVMKESTLMTRKKDTVSFFGLMEGNTTVNGRTANSMVWVFTLLLLEKLKRVSGKMARELPDSNE